MDREQVKRLIIETFENQFQKDTFVEFISNLLKTYDRNKTFTYQGNYIPDVFKQYINSLERIGQYTYDDKEIDLLIVKLKKESSLERARTRQRNFIAWYLKGSRGGKLKDAAIVAFVSPDSEDWRFSLVKMDYRFKETSCGKVKIEEEFTPAKRWSFLVGKNEKSHTAQSRLLPILENDNWRPTLEDLENAFNVEVVTKEFFEKYRDLFIRTKLEVDKILYRNAKVKKEFEDKNINTVDFAKKLLGQIVFLYFLQKKGWFGVKKGKSWGTGPKDFIRRLFNKEFGNYKNFYNDIFEPLFYEALRTDRSADDHYYSRFDCKIPFLNGGLFDPINNLNWVNVDILLPNELFSNQNKTKEGDIGDGILDIFDRYNFTVNEEEPLEKEVALDPELLGKIYEKLNAIRQDNFDEYVSALQSGKKGEETKFNKEYGVYYTPREIVYYMCKESLLNYLETELQGNVSRQDLEKFFEYAETLQEYETVALEKEEKVKSGEQKTTKYESKIPESIKQNAKQIDDLLSDIKVCDPAVGSGAFPIGMMLEIVKLRKLLSIYINRKINSYDLKRHCIENSLYGVDIDPGAVEICKLRFWLSMIVDEEDFYSIKPLPNLDYKVVCGDSLLGFPENWTSPISKNIEDLIDKYFSETNPDEKQKIKNQIDEKIKSRLENSEKNFGYKINFDFRLFFPKVFKEKNGFDVVIANPPYKFFSGKGSPIKKLQKEGKKREAQEMENYVKKLKMIYKESSQGCLEIYKWFIERGYQILKISGVLSYITSNTYITYYNFRDVRMIIFNKMKNKIILDLGFGIFEDPIVPTAIFISQKTVSSKEVIYSDVKDIPREKIRRIGLSSVISSNIVRLNLENGDLKIYKHPIAKKIYTTYENRLKDYIAISEGEHSLNNDFSKVTKKSSNSIPVIRDDKLKRYHFPKIVYLPKSLCKKFDKNMHSGERLFIRKTGEEIVSTLSPCDALAIAHQNLYVAKCKKVNVDIKFLLALLSSKLLTFLYQFGPYGQKGRILAQFRIYGLYDLPVPKIEKNSQQSFIDLVTQIFSLTQSDDYFSNPEKQAKVKELEHQIDQLVYRLYDLTEEEIKIIEENL